MEPGAGDVHQWERAQGWGGLRGWGAGGLESGAGRLGTRLGLQLGVGGLGSGVGGWWAMRPGAGAGAVAWG